MAEEQNQEAFSEIKWTNLLADVAALWIYDEPFLGVCYRVTISRRSATHRISIYVCFVGTNQRQSVTSQRTRLFVLIRAFKATDKSCPSPQHTRMRSSSCLRFCFCFCFCPGNHHQRLVEWLTLIACRSVGHHCH